MRARESGWTASRDNRLARRGRRDSKRPCQLERRFAGTLEPQAQRRQAAQGQPALERVAGLAERRGHDPRLFDQDPRPRRRPRASGRCGRRSSWSPSARPDWRHARSGGRSAGRTCCRRPREYRLARATVAMRVQIGDPQQGVRDRLGENQPGLSASTVTRTVAGVGGGVESCRDRCPSAARASSPEKSSCHRRHRRSRHDRSGLRSARKTAAIAPMPEAQTKARLAPFQTGRASRRAAAALGWPSRA